MKILLTFENSFFKTAFFVPHVSKRLLVSLELLFKKNRSCKCEEYNDDCANQFWRAVIC
jgi:hypothetical protein